MYEADLWIKYKHRLHGIVPREEAGLGYDFDRGYEDENG